MVSDDSSVDETAKVQALRSKLRHDDGCAPRDLVDARLDGGRAVKTCLRRPYATSTFLFQTHAESERGKFGERGPSTANHCPCSSLLLAI